MTYSGGRSLPLEYVEDEMERLVGTIRTAKDASLDQFHNSQPFLVCQARQARWVETSMDRPCLAGRSRSRSFTRSSRFRILTADTAITSRLLSMLATSAQQRWRAFPRRARGDYVTAQ